jgi:hypothetical protein
MISWQSLHIEVYRDSHDQASTSGDGDQTRAAARELDDQQGSAAADATATMIVYPIPAGLFSPRGRSSKLRQVSAHRRPREAASTTISGCTSGERSCLGN